MKQNVRSKEMCPGFGCYSPNKTLGIIMLTKMINLVGLAIVGLFLSGCATGGGVGLANLSDTDAAYYRQKIEPALGSTNCIKQMQVLMLNTHKFITIITLHAEPVDAEKVCLQAIHAVAGDPLIPVSEKISFKVVSAAGTRSVKDFNAPLSVQTSKGFTITGMQTYSTEQNTKTEFLV